MKKYRLRVFSIAWWIVVVLKLLSLPVLLIEMYVVMYMISM